MNCKKHGRLIVASFETNYGGVERWEYFCIDCIRELREPRCDNHKCSFCEHLHKEEREMMEPFTQIGLCPHAKAGIKPIQGKDGIYRCPECAAEYMSVIGGVDYEEQGGDEK